MRALPTTGRLLRGLGAGALAAGAIAIAAGATVYFTEDAPPFLVEKLPLPHEALWLAAVRVHVVATSFALPACLLLAWTRLRARAPRLHRWLGRAVAIDLLFGVVPSGLYLAPWAKAGRPSTLGFALSGALAAFAMVQSARTARAGDLAAHRRWSMHVLAQLAVAVASRALLVLFDAAAVDGDLGYVIALWLPVVAGALAVELSLPRSRNARRRSHAPLDRPRARRHGAARPESVAGV